MKASRKSVMIVEDDSLALIIEQRLLKRLGYDVIGSADEGTSALNLLRSSNPDVILMDLNLNGSMMGTDIVEQMRIEGNRTPVVFLSGEARSFEFLANRDLGCIDYLVKPISADKLDRSLRLAIEYKLISTEYAA